IDGMIDRRRRRDPERERRDGDDREDRLTYQQSNRVPNIDAQRVESIGHCPPAMDATVEALDLGFDSFVIAESTSRLQLRILTRHPGAHQFVDAALNVETKLGVHVGTHAPNSWNAEYAAESRPSTFAHCLAPLASSSHSTASE